MSTNKTTILNEFWAGGVGKKILTYGWWMRFYAIISVVLYGFFTVATFMAIIGGYINDLIEPLWLGWYMAGFFLAFYYSSIGNKIKKKIATPKEILNVSRIYLATDVVFFLLAMLDHQANIMYGIPATIMSIYSLRYIVEWRKRYEEACSAHKVQKKTVEIAKSQNKENKKSKPEDKKDEYEDDMI